MFSVGEGKGMRSTWLGTWIEYRIAQQLEPPRTVKLPSARGIVCSVHWLDAGFEKVERLNLVHCLSRLEPECPH